MKITRLNELIEEGKLKKGRWELTPQHELQYRSQGLEEEIKLKGALVAAEPEALVIAVTEKQSDQKIVTSLVKLSGTWKANSKNQLVFEVARESGRNDVLTFSGGWKINQHQELIYSYRRQDLKTKTKAVQELAFQGVWEISDKNAITYVLGGDSDSAFRFRGTFQTQSIYAKKGEIRYQAGVEVNGKRKNQTILLFGKWKISRDFSLFFEMEYENGVKKSIAFGGTYALTEDSEIAVTLKNEEGKSLGVELVLTKDFFGKDGQVFLRLQKNVEESRVEVGTKFRW